MSSILDALKKLEEEKQRQLKLLEKEEEEEQVLSEPISISAIAKPEKPVPLQDSVTPAISPKFLIAGLVVFVIVISIISISASLWVVKTQIAKNTISSTSKETIATHEKTTETSVSSGQPTKEETPQEIVSENKETPSVPSVANNTKEKAVVSEPPPSPTNINPPDKLETDKTSPPEKQPEASIPMEQSAITPEPPVQVAKNIPHEAPSPVVEEVKKETPPPTPPPEIKEEVPVEATKETSSSEASPPVENVASKNEITNPTDSQEPSVSQPTPSTQITVPPPVVTKDLEPPPSLKPEQFQQALSLPKPKTEETVDMTRLPVLRTSDRARLGLDDMKLNVLREAGPKNPHGLAIINLTKIYVGEMIPGTSVRLLDVKTHGIAIEVVGTGERYYVPR